MYTCHVSVACQVPNHRPMHCLHAQATRDYDPCRVACTLTSDHPPCRQKLAMLLIMMRLVVMRPS